MSKAIRTTYRNLSGWDWVVRTDKNSRGQIECRADAQKISKPDENGLIISEWGMDNPALLLARSEGVMRATEKTLLEYHRLGKAKFEAMRDAGELPVNETATPEENTLPMYCKLIAFGYGNRQIPCAIVGTHTNAYHGRTEYKVLVMDGENVLIHNVETIKPLSKKFGVGTYYLDSRETYTEAEILPIVVKAEQLAIIRERQKQEADQKEAEIKALGAQLYAEKVPSWAKAVIIAELMIDNSDPHSDYFHASGDRDKTFILAFSTYTQNNEQELRSAALNFEGTADMANQDTGELYKGHSAYDYRLQTSWRSGYHVRKLKIEGSYDKGIIARALALGNNFAPINEPPQGTTVPAAANVRIILNEKQGGVEIHFTGKPEKSILSELKANGWRWAKFNKCWYKRDTPAARQFASQYGTIAGSQGDQDPAAGMIQANEDAYFDNWAANNL
jgi:hypothetical protein